MKQDIYLELQKSLNQAWSGYRKVFKNARRSPSRKTIHQLRNAVQKLNAILFLSLPLQRKDSESRTKDLIGELQKERKFLGPLRNAQVELQLLKGYEKDSLYRFIQRHRSQERKRVLRKLGQISLKKQRSSLSKIEDSLFKQKKIQTAAQLRHQLEDNFLSQEQRFENALPKKSHLKEQDLHLLRVEAKQILYQGQALKQLVGHVPIDLVTFEKFHQLVGEIQNDTILLKWIDRYLDRKKHSKDKLAIHLKLDLSEDQKSLISEVENSLKTTQWHH